MGKRGPAPTPTKVLQMRGTHRRDRHGDPATEPTFGVLANLPPAPGFLDETGVFEWERVGPQLVVNELLTEVDLAAFTLYCVSVSRVRAAERSIAALGIMIDSPQGVKANPAVAISRQAGVEVRKFCQEFGLTPSARTRVRPPAKQAAPADDPWSAVAG